MPAKRTATSFIEDAGATHDGRYDYSLVEYVNNRTKVRIVCPDHAEFLVSPSNHLKGRGCPDCGRARQRSTATKTFERFVSEARSIHGETYQYDESTYSNARTRMLMTCPEHGYFYQEPSVHLRGNGCSQCGHVRGAQAQTLSPGSFKEKLVKKHGNRIHADYLGMNAVVQAHCRRHGKFETTAHALLYTKYGCSRCAREAQAGGTRLTNSEAMERLRAVFGDRYDYSQVKYRGSKKYITLSCSKHGNFRKFAEKAFAGVGCPTCAKEDSESRRLSNLRATFDLSRHGHSESFMRKAREQHGDFFDYSNVSYINRRTPVRIVCPRHGEFSQAPDSHLNSGCRKCADEELKGRYTDKYFERFPDEKTRNGTLYYIKIETSSEMFFKIGITTTAIRKRFGHLIGLGGKLVILATKSYSLFEAYKQEQELLKSHVHAFSYRPKMSEAKRGSVVGATECFDKPLPSKLLAKYFT